MELLPKDDVILTSAVDHADWNYSPLLAYIMRRRFALIRKLLPKRRVQRILEIGFGSGIFMPDLAGRCDELYGIDVHPRVHDIQAALDRRGICAELARQDAARMAYPDSFFDVIIAVSALEFIQDIGSAARETARVLKRDGQLVAVMPAKSPFLDAVLQALTGANPEHDYGNRRELVVPALLQHFRILRKATFLGIYTAYALQPSRRD